jgi:mono/diheme cytochrome c family protein
MQHRLFLTIASIFFATSIACAAQGASQIELKLARTAPTSGKQMFQSYCAPCHGQDGRGHGPLAAQLREQPANLTLLSRRFQGRYPDARIVSVLMYGSGPTTRGISAMPAWGPVLAKMDQANRQDAQLRIRNLIRYLETIQVP